MNSCASWKNSRLAAGCHREGSGGSQGTRNRTELKSSPYAPLTFSRYAHYISRLSLKKDETDRYPHEARMSEVRELHVALRKHA